MPMVDRSAAKLVICLLLIAAVWLVFGQATRFPFVNYDDPAYTNPVIAQGFTKAGFHYAFTFGVIGHWHPVTWISHMADFQIYGMDRPGGHHATSVALHTVSAILLFLLLSNLTGAAGPSAFVAFVFAIHPLRVESVAWMAERKDVLSGLFFILTLIAYVAWVRRRRAAWYVAALLLYALGLMSKNMVLTLPFVLLLLDYWPLRRELTRQVFLEKLPFLVLSIVSIVITFNVPERLPDVERVSFVDRLSNAVVTPLRYLCDTVYPHDLAVYYPYQRVPLWEVGAAFLVLAGVSIAAIVARKRAPYLLTGWFWYLVMLGPVAGVVQISNYSHADRYTYLPHIGVSIAIAWLADAFARTRESRMVLTAIAAVAVIAMAVSARAQTSVWSSSASLWTHDLEAAGPNAVAYHGLGAVRLAEGRRAEALHDFELAIAADPNYFPAHDSLGEVLVASGRVTEAVPQFDDAIRLWPPYTVAHCHLGDALLTLNRPQEALSHFEEAARLRPQYFDAVIGCGNAELRLGDARSALTFYRTALDIRPDSVTALANAGTAATATGDVDTGMTFFREALTRDPTNAAVHREMGNAFLRSNRAADAEAEYRTALRLSPNDAANHKNLGVALAADGNADGAISEYRAAIRDDPTNVEAYVLLGSALALRHEMPEATSNLERAAAIDRGENAVILDRLAAVYAMSGRFTDAARAATEGVAIAEKHRDAEAAASLRNDVKEYTSRASRH
jgi:tetratricopeptide (TPR) repeat protein